MTDLEHRLAALEDRVTELQGELDRRKSSMAQTRRCPACGSGSLFHFTQVHEHQQGHTLPDLALHHKKRRFVIDVIAPLEAFACRTCGLVEWHARALDKVVADGNEVISISTPDDMPPPASGPFR
ncbi:MAG: hypothetical protein ABI467_29185 [Kofleriaceae bacterium]